MRVGFEFHETIAGARMLDRCSIDIGKFVHLQ